MFDVFITSAIYQVHSPVNIIHYLFLSANSVLWNVFHFTLLHNYYGDAMLRTVFMPLYI